MIGAFWWERVSADTNLGVSRLNQMTSPFGRIYKAEIKHILESRKRFRQEREQIRMIDEEQDWIAKYRAALDSTTPIKPSRVGAFAMGLSGMIQKLVSAVVQRFDRKIPAPFDVKPVEELAGPLVIQAVASAPNPANRLDGSNTRGPGKRHFSGQDRRRRAS
jgi:hypothetical protein